MRRNSGGKKHSRWGDSRCKGPESGNNLADLTTGKRKPHGGNMVNPGKKSLFGGQEIRDSLGLQ